MVRADEAVSLLSAFPAVLRPEVSAVLKLVPASEHGPMRGSTVVHYDGEVLAVPTRVYFPEPSILRTMFLSGERADILSCLYSRHHDGIVRERHVRRLLQSNYAWVPPFVVQLAGEYVLEIIEVLAANLDRLQTEPYRRFVAQNPDFVALTRQRVISYWDCYYRATHANLAEYAGTVVLEALAGRATSRARRASV